MLGADLGDAFTLSQLSLRPGVTPELISRLLPAELAQEVTSADIETALADSLYAGYVEKQRAATERINHHDALKVPEGFDFRRIMGLSNEMIERLERARPQTFAQVRSINGLTPAAISAVLVHLTAQKPSKTSQN
jgi:tRNA uridine 5-carboxymethylaminomethyl modification enzyme